MRPRGELGGECRRISRSHLRGDGANRASYILADNPAIEPGDVFRHQRSYRGQFSMLPDVTWSSLRCESSTAGSRSRPPAAIVLFITASHFIMRRSAGSCRLDAAAVGKNLAEEGVLIRNSAG